jgi:signal transduction histidine kinase
VTELKPDLQSTTGGISIEVLVCGACLAGGFAASGFFVVGSQTSVNFAVMAAWSAFALAAGLLLDQRPRAVEGRFLAGVSLVPLVSVAWAVARTGALPDAADLGEALPELAGVEAGLLTLALPWVFCRPAPSPRLVTAATAVALGAATVPFHVLGWAPLGLGSLLGWSDLLRQSGAHNRTTRRRTTWLLVTLAGSGTAVATAWLLLSEDAASYLTVGVLVLVALSVTRLHLATQFRPVDEPALDALAALGAVAASALIGFLVWAGARWIDLPSPGTPAAFGALLTLAASAPGAVWLRRSAMASRYGTGVISPADVALITADLRNQSDPRELLDKAARMVAAASASQEVRVVLGADPPELDPHEVLHPLVVGGDQVGALVVVPTDEEGLELRQHQVIEQLVPTVALVARAVELAVETEHARRDLTRERELERRRILNDLHDVLGPVLAGMSMRVRGAMRTQGDPEVAGLLGDLAADLATSRADLRRMVSGLTPSALDEGGLETALQQLVGSFNATPAGPRLSLDFSVDQNLQQEVEVTVYRLVAEGVTNAVRHAGAHEIGVRVAAGAQVLAVEVTDDGCGGPVHPGVGLTSLAQRAESLGGELALTTSLAGGVALRLTLPVPTEVRS